jgi:hypothetical protein
MNPFEHQVETALADSPDRAFVLQFAPDGHALWVVFEDGALLELALSPDAMRGLGRELLAVADRIDGRPAPAADQARRAEIVQ